MSKVTRVTYITVPNDQSIAEKNTQELCNKIGNEGFEILSAVATADCVHYVLVNK